MGVNHNNRSHHVPMSHEEGCKLLAGMHSEMVGRRMDSIQNLTALGLRGLTIINGGALIALFTVIGHDANQELVRHLKVLQMLHAAAWFVAGLVLALVATMVGFFGQQAALVGEIRGVQDLITEAVTGTIPKRPTRVGLANGLIVGAAVAAAASLGSFVGGSWAAILAAIAAVH
jgi:MFS family permease